MNLSERFEDFFHILGGDADAIVLDLDAYRFVRLGSSRDDDPATVDLGLDLTVVMLTYGEYFGPLEYDIGVAQVDMARFFSLQATTQSARWMTVVPLIAVGPSANQ